MLTVFENNRNTLLLALGLPTQVEEGDVQIESFVCIDRDGGETSIEARKGNEFGRRFLEFMIRLAFPESKPTEIDMTRERTALTAMTFAERWDDRHTADGRGRPMLVAIGNAVRIEQIKWKEEK